MQAIVTKIERRESKNLQYKNPEDPGYYMRVFFRDVVTGKSYRTYADSKYFNFDKWLLVKTDDVLGNLDIKNEEEGIVDADSKFVYVKKAEADYVGIAAERNESLKRMLENKVKDFREKQRIERENNQMKLPGM